ncbi:MAG: HlyD family efflux transporter periplasmic adaptor subunit [Magnetococcales bacterium]|nr:HlyD family efflux transporter periplasmic adaptor subunit [Magnetococcales bacterium]
MAGVVITPLSQGAGLPPLREELSLSNGPQAADGSPTWTLHDPLSNRFFRLGWQEMEILTRWSLANPDRIADSIAAETTWQPTAADVNHFVNHLRHSHLLTPVATDRSRFLHIQQNSQGSRLRWLLHNYLSLRMHLWHPEPFLQRTLPLFQELFSGWFVALVLLVAGIGLLMILRQWESFTGTFLHFFNVSGVLYYSATLLLSKVVHELGHAYAATRYGCRVSSMGILWILLWPRLYTETSETWKLASRHQRLLVGGAGMGAELALAAFASLAWSFLEDGPLRSAAFLLASSGWLLTLMVNLNPLLRFDGYFLLSDALEVADLQQRAFRLGRWQLREWLFGWGVAAPEPFTPGMRRFLVCFAWSTWCYRLLLYVGIALLVYQQVFKVLGLLLLGVELGWFILRPMGQEIMTWLQWRQKFAWNRQLMRTTLLWSVGMAWLALPWDWRAVEAEALLEATHQMVLYAPAAAQVRQQWVENQQSVEKGALLLELEDPDLNHRLDKTERQIVLLRWQLAMQGLEREAGTVEPVSQQDLAAAQATLHSLRDEQNRLRIVAPWSGRVVELARDLQVGDWVGKEEALLTVVGGPPLVKGYVAARERERIALGAHGWFYPAQPDKKPLPGRLIRMDPNPTHTLPSPYLASLHGGNLPVRASKEGKLLLEGSYYRIDLALEPATLSELPVAQILPGTLRIQATPVSLLSQWWQSAQEIYRRESGF